MSMEAQWARAERAEAKHAEKLKKQQREQDEKLLKKEAGASYAASSSNAEGVKREKKITSTKERLARSKESKQAEAEGREISKPLETAFVVMEGVVPQERKGPGDGWENFNDVLMGTIRHEGQKRGIFPLLVERGREFYGTSNPTVRGPWVSVDDIRDEVRIDLRKEKVSTAKGEGRTMHKEALERLRTHPYIHVIHREGEEMYLPTFDLFLEDVLAFLQMHGSEASVEDIKRAVGFDLLSQGERPLEVLRANPRVEAIGLPSGGEVFKYSPPFGVRNRGSLAHLLSRATPGSGDVEAVPRSALGGDAIQKWTYEGVDADIDELLAQGKCVQVFHTDKKSNQAVRDAVLFANPHGRAATEEVRNLWRDVKVPSGSALQDALLARKLRTQQELDARKERIAARKRKQQELKEANGKKRKTQVRNISAANDHLDDETKARLFGQNAASKNK